MKKTDEQDKFAESVAALDHAMSYAPKAADDRFFFSGIAKSFEVCLEYAWKHMKRRAINEGLEVYSPKDAIKAAGRLKMIDDVERWLDFLEDRNLAVHDYIGVSDEEYLATIRTFLGEAKKLLKK